MAELRTRMGGLPSPDEASGVWREIWFQEAHNSTALEGNTLVLRQVEKLLAEGRAVGDKELKEYLEVQGYAEAAQWVYGQGLRPRSQRPRDLITLQEVREVHHRSMDKVWSVAPHPQASSDEAPGSFRRHDIEPFTAGMKPPDWPMVASLTRDWVEQASRIGKGLEFNADLLPGLQLAPRPVLEEVAAAHAHIRKVLGGLMSEVAGVRLLYGGSVKGSNAAELLAAGDVDGALIGGASLKADEFLAIAKAA